MNEHRVLVPGVGLGRLCTEIAARGYVCEGNEFSYFMLISSGYILNQLREKECVTIYPWIDNPCNVRRAGDMLREVRIPDVPAVDMLAANPESQLSMCAGDFQEVYSRADQAGKWDAVVTCFFIDTAPVLMDYVATIWNALRKGGVWINHGPPFGTGGALSRTRRTRGMLFVELNFDEVEHVIKSYGFVFEKIEWRKCTYDTNCRSMMHMAYDTVLFVARKPQ